jgi:hypothetical protein
VHLNADHAESQAIMVSHTDWVAACWQGELDAISSPTVRNALADIHVILVEWSRVKNRWSATP